MRLAIMQPYFLPYLGYFSLIAACDHFVIFDPVQYIRHGWINRNRILKPDFDQPQYIQVPLVKHPRQTLIKDIRISDSENWRARIFGQIQHYKKRAPYFDQTRSILEKCLELKTDSLVRLNVHCLTTICQALEIDFQSSMLDDVAQWSHKIEAPGDWAVWISKNLGATTYVNPPGGREIFDPQRFIAEGIELKFIENRLGFYSQRNETYVPGLSIVDVLMFNDREQTRQQILDYSLTSA